MKHCKCLTLEWNLPLSIGNSVALSLELSSFLSFSFLFFQYYSTFVFFGLYSSLLPFLQLSTHTHELLSYLVYFYYKYFWLVKYTSPYLVAHYFQHKLNHNDYHSNRNLCYKKSNKAFFESSSSSNNNNTATTTTATSSSKNRFYEVIDNAQLFNRLMMYSASNFCPEIALFLEEYQQLKSKVVAFFNMGEPGFDHPELDIDIDNDKAMTNNSSTSNTPNSTLKKNSKSDDQKPKPKSNTTTTNTTGLSNRNTTTKQDPLSSTFNLDPTPPFTSARITILQTLLKSPTGKKTTGQCTLSSFKVVPFALRSQFYGLYRIFIAEGGTLQINIEGRISDRITRLIESYQYSVDMLDEVHGEVLQMLYHNIYRKFMRAFHHQQQQQLEGGNEVLE